MRYFTVIDFQFWILSLGLGLVSVVLVYLAWASYPHRRLGRSKDEIKERTGHEMLMGHDATKNPIAPFLIFVYLLISIWALAYVYYTGVRGPSF